MSYKSRASRRGENPPRSGARSAAQEPQAQTRAMKIRRKITTDDFNRRYKNGADDSSDEEEVSDDNGREDSDYVDGDGDGDSDSEEHERDHLNRRPARPVPPIAPVAASSSAASASSSSSATTAKRTTTLIGARSADPSPSRPSSSTNRDNPQGAAARAAPRAQSSRGTAAPTRRPQVLEDLDEDETVHYSTKFDLVAMQGSVKFDKNRGKEYSRTACMGTGDYYTTLDSAVREKKERRANGNTTSSYELSLEPGKKTIAAYMDHCAKDTLFSHLSDSLIFKGCFSDFYTVLCMSPLNSRTSLPHPQQIAGSSASAQMPSPTSMFSAPPPASAIPAPRPPTMWSQPPHQQGQDEHGDVGMEDDDLSPSALDALVSGLGSPPPHFRPLVADTNANRVQHILRVQHTHHVQHHGPAPAPFSPPSNWTAASASSSRTATTGSSAATAAPAPSILSTMTLGIAPNLSFAAPTSPLDPSHLLSPQPPQVSPPLPPPITQPFGPAPQSQPAPPHTLAAQLGQAPMIAPPQPTPPQGPPGLTQPAPAPAPAATTNLATILPASQCTVFDIPSLYAHGTKFGHPNVPVVVPMHAVLPRTVKTNQARADVRTCARGMAFMYVQWCKRQNRAVLRYDQVDRSVFVSPFLDIMPDPKPPKKNAPTPPKGLYQLTPLSSLWRTKKDAQEGYSDARVDAAAKLVYGI